MTEHSPTDHLSLVRPTPAGPTPHLLHAAGWDDHWARSVPSTGLHPARVLRADRGASEVVLDDGPSTVDWGPALRRAVDEDPVETPAAGDWVLVDRGDEATGTGPTLVEVLPRRTAVIRLQAGRSSRGQVLAANADLVCVVEGLDPDPDTGRVERLLALAWASGATPAVVLTKADLVLDPQDLVDEISACAPGCPVWAVSTLDGYGLTPLREQLALGRTVALLGASGVGKSTLLNALVGEDVMTTRVLGAMNKGRHTTVTRELHLVPGGERCWTRRACAASASRVPRTSTTCSRRSTSWPPAAGSATARTPSNQGVPSWRPSRPVGCRSGACAPTASSSGSSSTRRPGSTRGWQPNGPTGGGRCTGSSASAEGSRGAGTCSAEVLDGWEVLDG